MIIMFRTEFKPTGKSMKLLKWPALSVLLILTLSCSDNNTVDTPDFTYLVSEDFNRTITQSSMEFFWTFAGQPDAAAYINYDVDVYRIVYQTTDLDGSPIDASGAIIVPKNASQPGLLSIQHATIFSNAEAPYVDAVANSVVTRKAIFSSVGNIVFLPDYLGYGVTSQQLHPYQHKESLASASFDMMMAGLEFLESNGIEWSGNSIDLIGYSEGAYATLALTEKMENGISPLQPGLVSMGAPIFDLSSTMDFIIDNIDQPAECVACYAYFLKSYHEIYELSRPLDEYFNSPYDDRISSGLFDGSQSAGEVVSQLPESLTELFTDSFIERYLNGEESELEQAVLANTVLYVPEADVLLVHGDTDGVAPIFNSDDFEVRAQQMGKTNLTYIRPEGVNHSNGIFPWGLETLARLSSTSKQLLVLNKK